MEFKTDTQIELQKNANLARLHDVGMVSSDSEMYKAGWEDFKRMIYEPLRESQNASTSDEALHIADVVIPFSEIETAANHALERTRQPPNPTTTERELMLGRRAFINGAIWYRDKLNRK